MGKGARPKGCSEAGAGADSAGGGGEGEGVDDGAGELGGDVGAVGGG